MDRSDATIEDADKNEWTMADFSVMMVAVVLGPQQIGRYKHRRARLQWRFALSDWNHAGWGHIVFSDEPLFQLCSDDNRRRVWRCQGQRADPAFRFVCHTGPQPDIMVWGAISFDRAFPLFVIRGTLIAQCVSEEILATSASSLYLKSEKGLIFHIVNVISFSAKKINLWWLKLDLLSSGIVKAAEPTTEDASATDDAEAVIIINRTKLVNNE
ncbi:uncharacterized protein TNCV_4377431 [Trichonephila clavipes]|nr:uncharacterized protein TNCV_4377431 [Trichonephila clavipes]